MKLTLTLGLLGLLTTISVSAQEKLKDPVRDALDACMTETGVQKPAPGTKPSEIDKKKLETCMSKKNIDLAKLGPKKRMSQGQAIDESLKENGLKKEVKPTPADRAKMQTCMEGKGFKKKKEITPGR